MVDAAVGKVHHVIQVGHVLALEQAAQFEEVRTNLLPGIKTLSANIGHKAVSLPMRLFEVGDVAFCSKNARLYDAGARNERRLAAIIYNPRLSVRALSTTGSTI